MRSLRRLLRWLPVITVAVIVVACPASSGATATGTSTARSQTGARSVVAPRIAGPRVDSGNAPITFDELPLGTSVTDDYADRGVVFTSGVFTTKDDSNPTWPVLSGAPKFFGDVTAKFVVPGTTTPTTVNGFSLDVGYIDNRNSVVVDYLDDNGNVVGSQYAQSEGINHLSITYRGVAGFTVYTVKNEPNGFAIDNLVIDPVVSAHVTTMASMGDSYSSGEGRTDGKYDCGTDLWKGTYYQDTTVPYYDPFWVAGLDCDTRSLSYSQPADLFSRPVMPYDERCHRNGQAYPNLIAQALAVGQFIFVACSGATTDNIGATDGWSNVTPAPEHPQSPVNVAGGHTQLTDVSDFRDRRLGRADPDVITIGIGGNDAGFAELVSHCARPWVSDCKDGSGWASRAINTINGDVFDRLVDTYSALRSRFRNSTLLVFGYPTVIDPGATCGGRTAYLDSNETQFLGGTVVDALNQAVSDAAAQAGAYYIDIHRVTQGHDVCSADPWINGLIIGLNGVDVESFHPNVAAHQAIARYFTDHYTDGHGNLLVANPEPASTIRPSVGQSMHLATLDGTVQQSCGAQCLQPAAACVQACTIQVQGSGYAPGAQLQVVVHSTPFDLGTVVADSTGHVDKVVTLPAGIEPGLHFLTMDGRAPDGSDQEGTLPVNVYATAPPPLRVHPVAPAPLVAASPPAEPVAARKPRAMAVGVRVRRNAGKLTVRLTCPRSASPLCSVALTLRQRVRGKHGRTRTVTVLDRHLSVAAGKSKVLVLRGRALGHARLQLRVVTTTSAGSRTALLRVPR